LGNELESEEARRLAAFLLGGLIFGGYAQQMESEHFLQPKRSRLFLAVSLHAESARYSFEDALFAELKANANTPCEDLPWRPTFFPYLLDRVNKPTEILEEVIRLRNSAEVVDYRSWLKEVIVDWKNNGRIRQEKRNDVHAIAQRIGQVLGTIPSTPQVEVKMTVADAVALQPPGGIDLTPALNRLWGWFLASLPGNRYRKLLTRAIVRDHEYVQLEKRVQKVWRAGVT
jgi:hypothetical protein